MSMSATATLAVPSDAQRASHAPSGAMIPEDAVGLCWAEMAKLTQ